MRIILSQGWVLGTIDGEMRAGDNQTQNYISAFLVVFITLHTPPWWHWYRYSLMVVVPFLSWTVVLPWIWKTWKIDAETDDRIGRSLSGLISGLMVAVAFAYDGLDYKVVGLGIAYAFFWSSVQ